MKKTSLSWENATNQKLFAHDWEIDNPKAVICLVHGMGEHCERYHHVADFYAQHGFAMMAFDHVGHGKSDGKRGHMPNYDNILDDVDLLLKKVDEKYPGIPKVLYGHSMGGNVTLNYILKRNPDISAFVTTGPWVELAFKPPSALVMLGKVMRNIFPGFSQDSGLDTTSLSTDAAVVKAYEEDQYVHGKITAATGMNFMDKGQWLLAQDAKVKIPTLIMHGGDDKITSPDASQKLASQLKGDVTFKRWNGMYHEIHNEVENEQVFNYTLEWLNSKL